MPSFSLKTPCPFPGPSRDAAGAQEVLQPGRHQRPPQQVDGAVAATFGGADDVDAAIGLGHGTQADLILAEGNGAAHGEPHLWNGEITHATLDFEK